jgi:hypothetical protein
MGRLGAAGAELAVIAPVAVAGEDMIDTGLLYGQAI